MKAILVVTNRNGFRAVQGYPGVEVCSARELKQHHPDLQFCLAQDSNEADAVCRLSKRLSLHTNPTGEVREPHLDVDTQLEPHQTAHVAEAEAVIGMSGEGRVVFLPVNPKLHVDKHASDYPDARQAITLLNPKILG